MLIYLLQISLALWDAMTLVCRVVAEEGAGELEGTTLGHYLGAHVLGLDLPPQPLPLSCEGGGATPHPPVSIVMEAAVSLWH